VSRSSKKGHSKNKVVCGDGGAVTLGVKVDARNLGGY